MRVIFDIVRDGLSAINTASSQLAKAQREVSTGRRISVASDDPLGTQQAIGDREALSRIDAYSRANDAAASKLATADSVLTSYSDKLTTAMTTALGVQGTQVNPSARAAASQAIRSLRDALVSDLNTSSHGSYLFSGTAANTASYANVGGTWTYQGNAATTQVDVANGRSVSVSFNGQAIAQGSDSTDVFTQLDALATAIDNGDNPAIGTGIAALQRAFDRAQRAQGLLGADQQTTDSVVTQLTTLKVSAEAHRSKVEDANMAEAVSRLTQADTAYKAALGAVSTAEKHSLLDYLS
jgi:flagellar hook-associated protein 3 FlgL